MTSQPASSPEPVYKDYRTTNRAAAVIYRTSYATREKLKARAAAADMNVQDFLDHVLWGDDAAQEPTEPQERLPMTG